jgi:hypothetical protein
MKTLLTLVLALISIPAFAATSLSTSGLMSFVIYLVIVGLIFWVIWWFIGFVGVPEPFNKVIRVVVGLFALIFVVNLLLGLVGTPIFNLR